MKKVICILFFAAVAYSAFCQSGTFREVSGEVEYKLHGASAFTRAFSGDVIPPNALVSTGFRSTAIIEVGTHRITVRPLTRLSLAEIQKSESAENIDLHLQSGRIRVDVNPPAGSRTNFKVQSPSATASVRGTSFEFDTVNLAVDEGRVIFQGNKGPAVIVGAGNQSFIDSGSASADPANVITGLLMPPSPLGTPPPETLSSSSSTENNLVEGDLEITF